MKKWTYICSKHFVGGNGPTPDHPDPIPAEYTPSQVYKDSIVNEHLSPERIFASSKSFHFKFVISRFLYCKRFSCDEKKNVSVCNRRKPNNCNPKNDFDRDFLARALCIMVIMKLHPLFIYIMYMYVQKRYFHLWFKLWKTY